MYRLALPALMMFSPLAASAADVVRTPLPGGSTFPISAAVEVPAGKATVYLSGMVPPVADADAPAHTDAA